MEKEPSTPNAALIALSRSQVYRDYERAFTQGTGLPLRLQGPDMLSLVRFTKAQENPFCTIMAKTNESCAQCYSLQCKVEAEAQFEPLVRIPSRTRADC